ETARDGGHSLDEVLTEVDLLLCEDTRVTARLFAREEVPRPPLRPLHEHNEEALSNELAAAIAAGQRIALVSDAGMPAISDPGFRLVRACRARGLPVHCVPGPTAFAAALAVSGLPTDQFAFFGFLPPKSAARRRHLEAHRASEATLIFYESTHRIHKFLDEIVAVLGPERCICLARELTKLHETVLTGPASEVRERLRAGSAKGEFVLLIAKPGFAL
ncbi:MAG: 16S rRNA (cytidine(1402)-2'-O)-methyltransferase, partial [Opitutales bacterium]